MRKIYTKVGQSLFEVVFAVGIAALVVVGVVSLARRSISNSDFSKNNALATKYAVEAREWIRQQRDASWEDFQIIYSTSPYYCLDDLAWGNTTSPCGNIPNTIFYRTVNFSYSPVNIGGINYLIVEAKVMVKWSDGSGEHEVVDISKYTNWNI